MKPLWWAFFESGFPFCCVPHAEHYYLIRWDIGPDREMKVFLSLS
jgi:hypothetical protein